MLSDDQPINEPRLSEADIEAIDRIFENDPESFIPESDRDHHAGNLLSLLGTPVEAEHERESRADLIALLASRLDRTEGEELVLSADDQEAVDQYVNRGFETGRVDPVLRERAAKLDGIGNLLATFAAAGTSDLVERTLGTVQQQIEKEESSMRMGETERSGFRVRWSDLISVAAMFLLAASVIMPIMSGLRANAQQGLCYDNMHSAAQAFGMYANSNRDMLPMATAGFGPTWMDVGTTPERSNSSNLYTLVRKDFVGLDDLACPSNPHAVAGPAAPDAWDWNSLEEVSYSYRIMPRGGMRATANHPVRVVLLADRSPVVLRAARSQPIRPEQNSPNHGYTGQHMLMLDGSSHWATSPVINNRQDNIWLPRPIEQVIHTARSRLGISLEGNEQPGGPTDAFVGP